MRLLTPVFAAAVLLATTGCSLVYKLPVNQGNVIDNKELRKVEIGMTPAQVEFLLGSALVKSDLAAAQRWDYVSYYLNPRGRKSRRSVSLFFENDTLARIEGEIPPEPDQQVEESESIKEAQEQAKEAEEPETIDPDKYVIPEDNDGLVTPDA